MKNNNQLDWKTAGPRAKVRMGGREAGWLGGWVARRSGGWVVGLAGPGFLVGGGRGRCFSGGVRVTLVHGAPIVAFFAVGTVELLSRGRDFVSVFVNLAGRLVDA